MASRAKPWALAAASGLLLLLSFPPFALWPLAWVALLPLLAAALESPDPKSAADLGAFAGLVFYGLSLHWLTGIFGPVAAAFWCIFSLWLGLFAGLLRRFRDLWPGNNAPRDLAWALLAGALWTGLEYFRAETWRLNCAWLALGYSQVPCPPVLQLASLGGVYGLSVLLVSFNAACWLFLRGRRIPAAALAAALLGAAAWGKVRAAGDPASLGRPVKVALVQDESADADRLALLSLGPGAREAELLVWPEYAFVAQPGREEEERLRLAAKLRGSRAVTVAGGGIYDETGDEPRERNFAWVLAPGGALIGSYDKLHPIPFMENFLRPNPAPAPVETPLGRLGIQICYDLDFQDGSRVMARGGAELLIVPNLDPLEWSAWQHRQHSAMSPVRAVETGLWIVRAASSGMSQIIDPTGRVRASLPVGASGVLVGEARLGRGGTFCTAWGWLLGPLCLGIAAAALARAAAGFLRRRRGERVSPPGIEPGSPA